jgi:hypothetical protein
VAVLAEAGTDKAPEELATRMKAVAAVAALMAAEEVLDKTV